MFGVSVAKTSSANQTSTTPKSKRKATRVQWACFSCRKRKQGCDAVRPCKRCVEKGIPCVEVESKRRRGRLRKEDALMKSSKHNEAGMEISTPPLQLEEEDSSDSEDASSFDEDDAEMVPIAPKPCKGHQHHHHHLQNAPHPVPHQQPLAAHAPLPAAKSHVFHEQKPTEDSENQIAMMDTASAESVSCDNHSGYWLNLALLSPYLEKFAESSDSWLGNFMENDPHFAPTLHKYEFLGNLFCGDILLDPFAIASGNPESCSLEFCYKLLFQKLGQSESHRKLYNAIKDKWKEVLTALKSLEWTKAQDLLSEIDFKFPLYSPKVFSKAPAVVMWSPGGRIHLVNHAFCYLTGYSSDELKVSNGQETSKVNANMLFPSQEIAKILQKQLEAIQTSESSVCSFLVKTRIITKNHQEVAVSCSINNLRDTFGSPILTTMFILC